MSADGIHENRLSVLALLFVLVFISGAAARAETLIVENISFNSTEDGLTVYVKTSGSIANYRCDLYPPPASPGERAIVVDLPGAESSLGTIPEPTGDLLLSAALDTSLEDGRGVRIRFLLDKGTLAHFEEVSQGLLLYFVQGVDPNGSSAATGSDAYMIGVGDQLEISVFGHDDLHRMAEVRADGMINYPILGDVQVRGKSILEVKESLATALARDYLVNPQVSVEVREYRSQWVTIIGAVRNPSRYVLVRHMNLIDLLAAAGGLSAEAGSDILITRHEPSDDSSRQIDIARDDLFSRDNESANIPLALGDIVTVTEREFFYIRGEVNRPDAYIFKNGMTVLKAISIAGGFSQFANRKQVELLRMKDGKHDKTTINIKAIENGKEEDIALQPEDTVIVTRRIF